MGSPRAQQEEAFARVSNPKDKAQGRSCRQWHTSLMPHFIRAEEPPGFEQQKAAPLGTIQKPAPTKPVFCTYMTSKRGAFLRSTGDSRPCSCKSEPRLVSLMTGGSEKNEQREFASHYEKVSHMVFVSLLLFRCYTHVIFPAHIKSTLPSAAFRAVGFNPDMQAG